MVEKKHKRVWELWVKIAKLESSISELKDKMDDYKITDEDIKDIENFVSDSILEIDKYIDELDDKETTI